MKKQNSKIKIIILILITFMISLIPTVVQAGKTDKLINLPTKESNKREVVFSKLNLNGNVEGIYVVNHFHPKEKINLVDYGNYSEVIHLIGPNPPIIKENKILIDNVEGPYYYQGNLINQELPWKFNIIWNHNGEIKSPQELSGVYGKVKLEINITKNEKIDNHFFNHYALQINIPINPEKAQVEAASEGFTLAYTGSKQQISYMILPGLETTITVILNVEDFSMDQITIAGVPLSIDFDINSFGDIAEMLSPLKELENGITQFANGSLELQKGFEELLDAYQTILNGSKDLKQYGNLLNTGIKKLKIGINDCTNGVGQYIDGVTQLSNGYKEFDNGLQTIYQGTKQLNEESTNLRNGSQNILNGLNEIINQLPENLDLDIPEITQETLDQLDQLVEGSEQIKNSLEELAKENGGLDLLHKGLTQIKNNLINLKTQADQFIVPDQDLAPKDANTWKNEMMAIGFNFNGNPATEAMFYSQLEAMSNLVSNYKPAVLMLQGTINGLLDQTNGIPALEYGVSQILDGVRQLSFSYNGTEQNPGLHDDIAQLVNQVKNLAN